MAKIIIPTPLRKFTDNQSAFETQGRTVSEAMNDLTDKYQDLRQYLLDQDGQVKSFVRVYLGDDDINTLQREATELSDDSVVSIVPAIAGG